MMRFVVIVFFLCINFYVKGQDSLILLNGKSYSGITLDTAGIKIKFNLYRPGKKPKLKTFYRDQVFSITNDLGKEYVFYYPNFYIVDDYTVDNMRLEIYGRIDGRKGYKTKWVFPVGIATGFLSGYLMEGSVLSAVFPVAYVGIVQIPIVKIQHESISNPDFIGNDFYAGGYNRSARMKRTTNALISGFVGLAAGIFVYGVTH